MRPPTVRFDHDGAAFYPTLKRRVTRHFEQSGRSSHANAIAYAKAAFLVLAVVAGYALLLSDALSPGAYLGVCALLGLTIASVGFNITHDAIHGCYSPRPWINRSLSLTFFVVGINDFVWRIKHNILHHGFTNIPGIDYDIDQVPYMRISQAQEHRWFHRYQHLYIFLLYPLTSLAWIFVSDYERFFITRFGWFHHTRNVGREAARLLLSKLLYYVVFLVLPLATLEYSWQQVLLGFVVMHACEGAIVAFVFQVAHVVEATDFPVPRDGELASSWASHQLHTTANFVARSSVFRHFLGGTNFQIEHHLFPKISHVHLPEIAPIVEQTAREFGLPYHRHPSFMAAVISHLRSMRGFGRPPSEAEPPTPEPGTGTRLARAMARDLARTLSWNLGLGIRRILIWGYSLVILGYYVTVCAYHRLVPKRTFLEEIGPRPPIAVRLVEFWHWFHVPLKCWLCRAAGATYELKFSRLYIRPFVFLNYADPSELAAYRPPDGKASYECFQDFFTRDLAEPLRVEGEGVWPCDGLLCQQGRVSELDLVDVKGERRHIRAIFGAAGSSIDDDAWFRNVFLHNRDYHHIHCPVTSVIDSIERIPGDRIVLRPWFHLDAPSRPALMNERLIVGLTAADGQRWLLAIVGGPVVGSIAMAQGLGVGSTIAAGDKLASFRLGSTCCITSSVPVGRNRVGERVRVGRAL